MTDAPVFVKYHSLLKKCLLKIYFTVIEIRRGHDQFIIINSNFSFQV